MLRRAPHATLEAAAMAAGAAPNAVFPLDARTALGKIREIRRNTVYWNSGSESENLLRTGEAVMGQLWHTRARVLEQETRGRIRWTFNQAVLQPGTFVVLRGSPAGEMAQRLLASMQAPAEVVMVAHGRGTRPAIAGDDWASQCTGDETGYPPTGNPAIGNASVYCAARYKHNGGSVYLLADGHVKWFRGPDSWRARSMTGVAYRKSLAPAAAAWFRED